MKISPLTRAALAKLGGVMPVQHLYLIAVAAILGCAPARGTSGTPGTPPVPRKANILTAGEIALANADVGTAYDAISRLRPNWLTPHGVSSFNTPGTEYAIVYVEGQEHGDLNTLRDIPAYHVAEFRYYNVTEAGARFGLRAGAGGVIEVTMKVRD